MKRLKNIEFIAEGGGRYNVYLDGELISWHNTFHKAQERATQLIIDNPESEVYFEQSLRVNVKADFDTIELVEPPEDSEPTNEPVFYGVFKTE